MALWGKTDATVSLPKFLGLGQVKGVNVTTAGSNYSQGVTITFSAAPGGGTTATGTPVIVNGAFTGVTITNPGKGYVTAPTFTITKPTTVTGATATGVSGEFTITVGSAAGVYVGMGVTGTNIGVGAKVTAINGLVVTLSVANSGAVSASNIAFTDNGSGAALSSSINPITEVLSEIVYVDETEAQVASNKTKGIKGPGWYRYKQYTDSNGQPRYKAEMLVSLAETAANAGDASDDLFVPDATITVSISVQPANQTTVSGAATFGVTAALSGAGTVTYQWERQLAGATGWEVLVGETASTLVLAAQDADNTGDKYRVVVGGAGAKALVSDAATLTFGT